METSHYCSKQFEKQKNKDKLYIEQKIHEFIETSIRYGVVGNISACHADARGSIPRTGVNFFFLKGKFLCKKKNLKGGVSGFRSLCLVLAKDARFQLRQYPEDLIV